MMGWGRVGGALPWAVVAAGLISKKAGVLCIFLNLFVGL